MIDFHRMLLADEARTLAFQKAIAKSVKPGDVVVDLGSGSGILSFFACQAGARRVYAIEKQHSADLIALLARQNGFGDRVTVVHEYSMHVELPERADVLITEVLGMFGINEQILGLTVDARRRLLREGAAIIPRHIALFAVPVEAPDAYDRYVRFWTETRYGIDFTPVRTFASNDVYATDLAETAHLAAPLSIIESDLSTIETADAGGSVTFTTSRDGVLHGFGGWFRATLAEGVELSNAAVGATHWQQSFLPLETPVSVARGDEITLALQTHDGHSWRWRGRAAGIDFDQTTWLGAPPCTLLAK